MLEGRGRTGVNSTLILIFIAGVIVVGGAIEKMSLLQIGTESVQPVPAYVPWEVLRKNLYASKENRDVCGCQKMASLSHEVKEPCKCPEGLCQCLEGFCKH